MIKYKRINDFKFVNNWTQLQDIVSQKSLYNADDYSNLSVSQKEAYLLQLYQNNDALAVRLGEDYYSEYGDTQTRYSLLMAEVGKINAEKLSATEDGRAFMTEQFNQQFNKDIAKDIDTNQAWVNELVQSKYSGNYAKFLEDYSGNKGYNDLLLEQLTSAEDITQESFNTAISDLSTKYTAQRQQYDQQAVDAYNNVKQYVAEKLEANARREAYENASWWEKTLNTLWQMPLAWVAEVGNIVEGIIDACAGLFAFNEDVRTFVEKDIIPLDTMILNATDASWLSPYADDNAAKWIHEIGVNIIDMAPLALNIAVPGLGSAIYYTSSAGKTMENELRTGYSYGEALGYTITSTAIEYGTESISGSAFFNKGKGIIGKWEKFGAKHWTTKMVHDFVGEGLEEVIAGVGNGIMHGVITGDYQVDGKELWRSFLIGGMVGGIMAGGNTMYRHAIVNKTKIRLENANGNGINLSVGKAQVVSQYVKTIAKKLQDGKTLSTKEQARYGILKDIKINSLLDRRGNKLEGSKTISIDELIKETVEINKKTRSYQVTVEKGLFEKLNPEVGSTDDADFKEKAKQVEEQAKAATPQANSFETPDKSSEATVKYAYDITSEEDKIKAQNDFTSNGIMTLGKMIKLFGEDAVIAGIEGYAKWADKTIDEVIALLTVGTESSQLKIVNDGERTTKLKEAFNNADFALVDYKPKSLISAKAKNVIKTVNNAKQKLSAFKEKAGVKGGVYFFVTTESTVSTSFFIDNDLYIDANWLNERETDFVKDAVVAKLLAQNARLSFKDDSTKALLREIVNKMQSKNRSADIVEQDMVLILLYTRNNPLMQQLLAMAGSKEDRNRLIKYFSTLRTTYAGTSVVKASGAAISNMVSCSNELFEVDDAETDFNERQSSGETPESILLDYINRSFRAFPGVSGNNGVPVEYAKLNVMYLHFKNKFGFNKELDLTKDINWFAELSDANNYSPEGYKQLRAELEKFQPVVSGTGFEIGTISTKKSFNELLNYYLDMYCGIVVTRTGVLSSDDFVTTILNMNAIDLKIASYNDTNLSREPIGRVGDFVREAAKKRLSNEVLSAKIYLYADSKSSSAAFINGTPGSGMQIFLNLPNLSKQTSESCDIGGMKIALDENTGLPIEENGKYKTLPYQSTVSKAAVTFAHEVGHAIAMSLGIQGTLSNTAIVQAWLQRLPSMSVADRTAVINSVLDWLFEPNSTDLRPDRLNFAGFVKDNDVKSWRAKLVAMGTTFDRRTAATVLKPLASYLYFAGFANELYAGLPGTINTAAVARDDTIQTRLTWNNKDSTNVIYLSEEFKKTAPAFILLLDGHRMTQQNSAFGEMVEQIMNSTENVTRRVYTKLENVQELKEEFGVELDSDLINPDFWLGKIEKADVSVTGSNFMTRESLIADIESEYGCNYENGEFVSGFVSNAIKYRDTGFSASDSYSCILYNDGSVRRATDSSAYTNESDINAVVIYNKTNKQSSASIRINTARLSRLERARLNEILKATSTSKIIAGGNVFASPKAAIAYLNDAPTTSPNETFEVLFSKITQSAITEGRQKNYTGDTLYITTDGKIYNTAANMATWHGYAESANVPENVLGKYTADDTGAFVTDNPEGISYNLSRLMDEKRLVRLYRRDNSWLAYGVPNQMQEAFIRELKAELKSELPYNTSYRQAEELAVSQDSSTATKTLLALPYKRLFINSKGDQHIEIHSNNWSHPDFTEVDWKVNQWYHAIRKIITDYNITKFSDFEKLGFSLEFIERLKSAAGKERVNKKGERYVTGGGINRAYILEYIRDDSNTTLSRNILIENAPKPRREDGGGDWKLNAHIRSIESARNYYEQLRANSLLLQDDGIVYDSWSEFNADMAKASHDPALVNENSYHSRALEKAGRLLGHGEVIIRLLNADAYAEGRGLDISTDGFKLATNSILYKVDTRKEPETELTITDSEGKERDKIASTAASPDAALLEADAAETMADWLKTINSVEKEISDPDERKEQFETLLQYAYRAQRAGDDMRAIINLLVTKIDISEQHIERGRQIQKNIDRVEAYKKLEENSPEQLLERRKLIRYYEQLRNFKNRLNALENGSGYYNSLLKSVVEIGGYQSRMSQNFSEAYAAYKEKRASWDDSGKAKRDKNLNRLIEYREHFITNNNDINVIHMEYPGYYKNYELLYNMLRNWIAGKPAIVRDYIANKTLATSVPFAAAQTDIVNFINKWEADDAFRESIAAREKVDSYANVRSVRNASLTKADLDIFTRIPEDLPPITDFPKDAIQYYNDLIKDIDDLAATLSNESVITKLVKLYGKNFIYHLQRAYNDAIMPESLDAFISESRKDILLQLRTKVAKESGKSAEEITNIQRTLGERLDSTQKKYNERKAKANATSQARYIKYREFMADYALRVHDKLSKGKPITDAERSAEVKRIGEIISNYRWLKKIDGEYAPVWVDELSRAQTYKVVTGIIDAYYGFLENPKTDASVKKFENDVYTVLEQMKINRTVPGDKKNSLITIDVPETGKFDKEYVYTRLAPIFIGDVHDITNSDSDVLKFRQRAFKEEAILDEYVAEADTEYLKFARTARARNRQEKMYKDVTVVSRGKYNVRFNSETNQFEDLDGNRIESDFVDTRRLTEEEYAKYADMLIDKGLKDGQYVLSKTGNILWNVSHRLVIAAYDLPKFSKYYIDPLTMKGVDTAATIKYRELIAKHPEIKEKYGNTVAPSQVEKIAKEYGEEFTSTPAQDDFVPDVEDEIPSESDFTSDYMEDPGIFEPITEEPAKVEPKGNWSDTLPKTQRYYRRLSGNTQRILSYTYNKSTVLDSDENYSVNSSNFVKDNATAINEFLSDIHDMQEFIKWVESSPAIPLDSPVEANIFGLLNQITSNIHAPDELRDKAKALVEKLGSRAGRILGMKKRSFGLTPVDQMIELMSHYMTLTNEERDLLKTAAEMQKNAIKVGDYAAAEVSMQKVLEIVKKHEAELPTSVNPFARGLSKEDRATRMHNLIEKITSWRYFAMLGSPSTFFTKNIASNVIITSMDKVAELIASKLPQGHKFAKNYEFNEKHFAGLVGLSSDEYKRAYKQEYDRLVRERTVVNGATRALTSSEIETLENDARHYASQLENERRSTLITLSTNQVETIVRSIMDKADADIVNIAGLTKYVNDYIATRYKMDKKVPTAEQIATRANEYIGKKFNQYTLSGAVQEKHTAIVAKMLVKNGLIDSIMNDAVSKYDRGYDVKISALRQITLDADGKFDDISEREASILADAVNKNAPFKWELLNKYYRFIFKTMDWGDKKFIRPKIIKTVERLVASNMTDTEIEALAKGDSAARTKFEDFVAYATNDAMKTYFRENTDFYKKLLQLFPKNPVAQLVLSTLIPFPRMVINTMNTALSYSPVGFIKAWLIARNSDDAFTRLKVNKELGKAITGSSLIAIGAILAAAGLVGFDDDDEYGGAQIIIGDKIRIALSDLAPSAIPLVIGATITHEATEGFWSAATGGAKALLDATIVGEAINIFGGNKTSADFVTDSFTSYVNQFIPSIFRHVARTIDPAKKQYSSNKAVKVMQRVASSIPMVSWAVPDKIDPYTGDVVYQNTGAGEGWAHVLAFFNMFSPAKITANIESPVEIESKAVGASTSGPAKTYKINGVEYEIDDDVYYDYKVLRAKLYNRYASEVINTKAYKNMSLVQKKAKLKQLQNKATEEARKQLNIG